MGNSYSVYTDGAVNKGVIGYGFVVFSNMNRRLVALQGHGHLNLKKAHPGRNVEGELYAVTAALSKVAKKLKPGSSIEIYSDYIGCSKWFRREWSSDKEYVKNYLNKLDRFIDKFEIKIYHIPGHVGRVGNEMADALAKLGAAQGQIKLLRR